MSPSYLLVAALALSQPAGPFKIVVLAGEDSVNVIQQKTAVAPLVEVRDRNNNPVSGAVVTFAIQGGKAAAFQGGAATMTVTTSAAGQAAAAGLTPLTTGAVNISVSAAVQGQVVTAAITQVNVLTAAEAAAATASATGAGAGGGAGGGSGAAAGGGAAGGGGGLSATTIAVVGGVAAAGAVAATQVVGGGSSSEFYKSAFALDITATFGSCARQERYGGDLVVEIAPHDAGATLSGNAEIKDAYWDVLATTCTGAIRPGRQGGWGMPNAPVSGNDSALSFQASDTVPAGDGSGPIARYYKFNGSLSGSTIVGTFELSWTGTIGGFVQRQNLTLSKQ